MPEMLEPEKAREDDHGVLVLSLSERDWDFTNAESLHALLLPALDRPNVVIDTGPARFFDSLALSKLVKLHHERVIVRGFNPSQFVITSSGIQRLLEITGVSSLWPIYATLADALDAAKINLKLARDNYVSSSLENAADG